MSDAPRFWEEGYVPDESPAIDPETGTWKPKNVLREYEIGGHPFRDVEGPMFTMGVADESGKDVGTVYIPFDPADGDPDMEELEGRALEWAGDLARVTEGVLPEEIERIVDIFLQVPKVRESGLAHEMVKLVTQGINEHSRITVDTDDGTTPEQAEALGVEVARLLGDVMPQLVEAATMVPNQEGLTFWQSMARDIIAQATIHARSEAMEELGYTRDDLEGLSDDTYQAFTDRVVTLYRTGPYLPGAAMRAWPHYATVLGGIMAETLERFSDPESELAGTSDTILRKARANLGLPVADTSAVVIGSDGTPPRVFQQSLFGDGGYGWGHNSPIVIAGRHAFTAPKTAWETDTDGWPIYRWGNNGGVAAYTPGRGDLETITAAFEMVKRYSLKHQMLFHYLIVKHLTHATDGNHRPYGMFEFSVDEYLKDRRTKRHANGGYATEDRREVVELLHDLARTEVKGVAYAKKGRKKEPQPVDVYSKLILISSRVEGDDYRFAMRGGDFMYQIEAAGKQYALTTRALLQLRQNHDAHAISLGFFIQEQFRMRSRSDDMSRPFRVADLLEGAEIEIDRGNAGRFVERIEGALNTLCDPKAMDGAPILKSWKYKVKPRTRGRNFLPGWLDAGVILTPAQPYRDQELSIKGIGTGRDGRKPATHV